MRVALLKRTALTRSCLFCPWTRGAAIYCPANIEFNANWPSSTLAGQVASGALCQVGYTGFVSRKCEPSGHWSTTVEGACERTYK